MIVPLALVQFYAGVITLMAAALLLEDYLESTEHVPRDMKALMSNMRTLDLRVQGGCDDVRICVFAAEACCFVVHHHKLLLKFCLSSINHRSNIIQVRIQKITRPLDHIFSFLEELNCCRHDGRAERQDGAVLVQGKDTQARPSTEGVRGAAQGARVDDVILSWAYMPRGLIATAGAPEDPGVFRREAGAGVQGV